MQNKHLFAKVVPENQSFDYDYAGLVNETNKFYTHLYNLSHF